MAARVGGAGPPLVVISAAASGRGKTRWLEALTRELVRRGRRPGMVKHHPHGLGRGVPDGKDTERVARAGAAAQVLAEPGLLRLYLPAEDAAALLHASVAALCATCDVDIVLAEGFRDVVVDVRIWVGPDAPPAAGRLCVQVAGEESGDAAKVAAVTDRILAVWK